MLKSFLTILIFSTVTIAPAARLELVTSVPLVRARQVDFQGDFAWVAQNIDGAALINIKDPAHPSVIRSFAPDEMQPLYLKVLNEDNLLVTADRFRGLVIYDVHTPDKPTTVSVLPLSQMTTALDITETTDGLRLAILGRAGDGLLCVDITNPTDPLITDSFTTGVDFIRSVAVGKGIVYAADSADGGLKALQIVSPGRFEPLYQVNLPGRCQYVMTNGNQLYVGYNNFGFSIFDLPDDSDFTRPTSSPLSILTSVLRNRSRVQSVAVTGNSLVIANAEMGIDLYDVANTSLPTLSDEYVYKSSGEFAQTCAVYRNYIYVPTWEVGLMIFRLSDAPQPSHFNLENVNYAAEKP